MNQTERDCDQLALILRYCDRLQSAKEHFGDDYKLFCMSSPYQDSCSLCLIQIGEAVHRISDEFRDAHPQIEWSKIYSMRNHLVHGYEFFDCEIVWNAMEHYIPALRAFCEERPTER